MTSKEYDGFSDSINTAPTSDNHGHGADEREHGSRRPEYTEHDRDDLDGTRREHLDRDERARRDAEHDALADEPQKKGSATAGVWLALILGAALLTLLLIFVIQNNVSTSFEYMSWTFSLPLGVAMLLAAIAGALIMALVGSVRIAQLSWQVRKYRKQQEKMRSALHR